MANSWVNVDGLVSAQWSSMPSYMVNYTLNGGSVENTPYIGTNYMGVIDNTYHTAYNKNGLKIEIKLNNTGNTHGITARITFGNIVHEEGTSGGDGFTYQADVGIGFIWDENNNAKIIIMSHSIGSSSGTHYYYWNGYCVSGTTNYAHDLYLWIVGNPYHSSYGAAGGGSGHIADGEVPTFNKYMVGYNVPTSNDAETKTRTTTRHSPTPISGYAKEGNGYCRITYLGPIPPPSIKKITYDGIFTYVNMEYSTSFSNVILYISESAGTIDPDDDDVYRFTMRDSSGANRNTNVAKLALKGSTTYYFTIGYRKSTYDSYQYTDLISYNVGASSVSGIEIIDLTNIISIRPNQTIMNSILANYESNFDGATFSAGSTLGTNFVPPTYPANSSFRTVLISSGFLDNPNMTSLNLYYKNIVLEESGVCKIQWEQIIDYENGSMRRIDVLTDPTWSSTAEQLEDYISGFIFVLDHDNKRGVPIAVSGPNYSGGTVDVINLLHRTSFDQDERVALMNWYRYLYENQRVVTRDQLVYMDNSKIETALNRSETTKTFYFIYGSGSGDNAFPNGYNRFTASDTNDYADSELVITMKIANRSKINAIKPAFHSWVNSSTWNQLQPYTSSQRIRTKSSSIYGNTSWHLLESGYDVLDDINDDNDHIIVIKYKSKQHGQDEYSLDSIECYLDGVLKNTKQIYISGSQYAPNNGPLGNGKINNVSYSFPYSVYSTNSSAYHNINIELSSNILINQVQSCKIGTMNSMIFTAPYPSGATAWSGLVEKGDYVQDYGMDLISYYQRMCDDSSYTFEKIFDDTEYRLICSKDNGTNSCQFSLYHDYYDINYGNVGSPHGTVSLSLNSRNTYSHLYICFSFNNYVNGSQTLASSGYLLGEPTDNPSYLNVIGQFNTNSSNLYYKNYYNQIVKTCLKEFSLDLVK